MHATATVTLLTNTSSVSDSAGCATTIAIRQQDERGPIYIDITCGNSMANLGVLVSGLTPERNSNADIKLIWSKELARPVDTTAATPFQVDVFVDGNVVEIFAAGEVTALRVAPPQNAFGVEIGAETSSAMFDVDVWSMKAAISPPCK
jgi:hypothetical protein